jgi:hypothetical protein
MATITPADVRRYVARRQRDGVRNATINRELSVLKRAFALAIAAGRLTSRPHIPLLRENNVRRGFFEADEFRAVRDRLPPDLADLVAFLWITGWRWRPRPRASAGPTSRSTRARCASTPAPRRPGRGGSSRSPPSYGHSSSADGPSPATANAPSTAHCRWSLPGPTDADRELHQKLGARM